MSTSTQTRIGIFFLVAQLGLLLTLAGVLHLGVLPFETTVILAIIAMFGVLLVILALAMKGGNLMPATDPRTLGKMAGATLLGFVALLLVNLGLWFFFGAPLSSSLAGSSLLERLLVNVLSAICEENLFFGVYCVGKAANLPDLWIMGLSTLVFWMLHALVYNIYAFEMVLFLTAGRLVLTGLYAVTDHSDSSYLVHVIWNVINT